MIALLMNIGSHLFYERVSQFQNLYTFSDTFSPTFFLKIQGSFTSYLFPKTFPISTWMNQFKLLQVFRSIGRTDGQSDGFQFLEKCNFREKNTNIKIDVFSWKTSKSIFSMLFLSRLQTWIKILGKTWWSDVSKKFPILWTFFSALIFLQYYRAATRPSLSQSICKRSFKYSIFDHGSSIGAFFYRERKKIQKVLIFPKFLLQSCWLHCLHEKVKWHFGFWRQLLLSQFLRLGLCNGNLSCH